MSSLMTQSNPIHELSLHIGRILELDPLSHPGSAEALHRVKAATDALLGSITAASHAGVPRSTIEEMLAPVYAELGKCTFYRRTYTWPRGYPGDFETIEMICYPQRFVTARQSFADWSQEIALLHPTTQQHRNKVVKQALVILEAAQEANAETRILSAGCGGCPDIRMILPLLQKFPGRFVLVDGDPDALSFARSHFGSLADACEFVHLGALRYVKRAVQENQKFDLIFAGGLFDYFPDDKVAFFIGTSYQELLKPGGRLFFTNVADSPPSSHDRYDRPVEAHSEIRGDGARALQTGEHRPVVGPSRARGDRNHAPRGHP